MRWIVSIAVVVLLWASSASVADVVVIVTGPEEFPEVCGGDCNNDGRVTVAELQVGAKALVGTGEPDQRCASAYWKPFRVDQVVAAVTNALHGCPDR